LAGLDAHEALEECRRCLRCDLKTPVNSLIEMIWDERGAPSLPSKTISVRIDDELVTAREGQTILEAAQRQWEADSDALLPEGV
jgi:hypothetical protein